MSPLHDLRRPSVVRSAVAGQQVMLRPLTSEFTTVEAARRLLQRRRRRSRDLVMQRILTPELCREEVFYAAFAALERHSTRESSSSMLPQNRCNRFMLTPVGPRERCCPG